MLQFILWGADLFIELESGKIIPMTAPMPVEGITLPEAGTIKARFTERVRTFNVGQVISIAPSDLADVCQLIKVATSEILLKMCAYFEKMGIQIIYTAPPPITE